MSSDLRKLILTSSVLSLCFLLVSCNPLIENPTADPGYNPGVSPTPLSVPDHLVLIAGNTQVASIGHVVPIPPQVQVVDTKGTPFTTGVLLGFQVGGAGGSVGHSVVITDSQGKAATPWTLGSTMGSYSLTVGQLGAPLPGSPASITFSATAVSLPSVAHSSISGTSNITADGVVSSVITITLEDSTGTPVVGVTPTFSASGSDNTPGACLASNASGVSTCSLKSTFAETKTLSIVSPISLVGGTVTFIAGTATQFVLSSVTSQTAGGSFTLTVFAEDAQGNTATSYNGTVTLSSATDSQFVAGGSSPHTFTGGDAGVFTFSGVQFKNRRHRNVHGFGWFDSPQQRGDFGCHRQPGSSGLVPTAYRNVSQCHDESGGDFECRRPVRQYHDLDNLRDPGHSE